MRTPPAATGMAREVTSGADYSVTRQRWVRFYRLPDRAGDQYEELVVDPETGEVIHSCKEPLSEHRGRGAAKNGSGASPST
jgi:hypothetical protein